MRIALDWSWASGLFEGEGTAFLSTRQKTGYRQLVMALSMADKDVVEKFASVVGGSVYELRPYGLQKKPQYRCTLYGDKARVVLMTMLPWLGQRRHDKIVEVLSVWEDRRSRSEAMLQSWAARKTG